MDRRSALKRVAAVLGGTVSAPLISAVLSGCDTAPKIKLQTLSPAQNELVTKIMDLIIPATETPGAKDTGVNVFIDLMLTDWYPAEDRERFLAGLAELETQFQQMHSKPFLDATDAEQTDYLLDLDEKALTARKAGEKDLPFFGMMKELTLVGYYTSEVGMTEELAFQPAVAKFEGCIPLERVGKAWAEL